MTATTNSGGHVPATAYFEYTFTKYAASALAYVIDHYRVILFFGEE